MKRFAVSLIASLLAFTAGLVTASSWNATRHRRHSEPLVLNGPAAPCPPTRPQFPANTHSSVTASTLDDYYFAQGRLKVVPLRHKIEVNYPQLVGDGPGIRKINQHLREFAAKLHQGSLGPSKPGTYNDVTSTYQVNLATESYLGLTLIYYPYSDGAHSPTSRSWAVNYDLTSGKPLKLSDLFKRGSQYLEFISRYSLDELSSDHLSLIPQGLSPSATNFDNWHLTANGITFTFTPCKVRSCEDGEQLVYIPFNELEPLLKPGLPGKFQITYP